MSDNPLSTQMQALINYSNEATGEADTDLSAAVGHLVDGFLGIGKFYIGTFDVASSSTVYIEHNLNSRRYMWYAKVRGNPGTPSDASVVSLFGLTDPDDVGTTIVNNTVASFCVKKTDGSLASNAFDVNMFGVYVTENKCIVTQAIPGTWDIIVIDLSYIA